MSATTNAQVKLLSDQALLQLDQIKALVNQYPELTHTNYGTVGNLEYINYHLNNILSFLNGES